MKQALGQFHELCYVMTKNVVFCWTADLLEFYNLTIWDNLNNIVIDGMLALRQ